jgi:MFS family permease
MLGAYTSGHYSDTKGRRFTLVWGCLVSTLASFLSCLSLNFTMLIFFRFLFGFGMGFTAPTCATYISEIFPKSCRGSYFVKVYWGFTFGELIVILAIYLFFSNLETGNWRLLLFFAALPSLFSLLVTYFKAIPSARFSLLTD